MPPLTPRGDWAVCRAATLLASLLALIGSPTHAATQIASSASGDSGAPSPYRERFYTINGARRRSQSRPKMDPSRRQTLVFPLVNEVRSHPHEVWKVRAPALAICAVGTMQRAYGWLTPDSTRWQAIVAWSRQAEAAKRAECRQFQRRVSRGQSLALDAGHFVFLDQRDAVVKAMRRFFHTVLLPP